MLYDTVREFLVESGVREAAFKAASAEQAVTAGYRAGAETDRPEIDDYHPFMTKWLPKVEGHIPVARQVKNSKGQLEPHPTVGTGHYLSPSNRRKLSKVWGEDRLKAIMGGDPITETEDRVAAGRHMRNEVPSQLDQWNPNWRKLDPSLQKWLMLHAYSLGNNIGQFRKAHNAVNAVAFNPSQANLDRLHLEFENSRYAQQTGTRMGKMRPLFDAGVRRTLLQQSRANQKKHTEFRHNL